MDRTQIRHREAAIWNLMLDSWLAQYWVQAALKVVGIIGGSVVGAIGGGMDGPLFAATGIHAITAKGMTILAGVLASGLSGLLLLSADRERPHLVADVRRNLEALRELTDHYDDMIARESWRVDCDTATRIMMEAVEDSLLNPAMSLHENIQSFIDIAAAPLVDALKMDLEEDYTISVFVRDDSAGAMVRIAQNWFHEEDADFDQRQWQRGQGFTGQAWHAKSMIAVANAGLPETRQVYGLKPEDYPDSLRENGLRPDVERYKSFACIPIMVGTLTENPEPWGMLTVTSDIIGRFDCLECDTPGAANIPMLRLSAALLALLVAAKTNS